MEPPDSAIDDFRGRVLAALDRLRSLPPGGDVVLGPQDPQTGEAWDRLNVLGHMAEMLPFWTRQLRRGLRGEVYGRDEEGYRRRREGVDSGHRLSERQLRLQVDRGCGRLLALLDRLDEADLDRPLESLPGRPATVRDALEGQLVKHLEEHLDQLMLLS